ncbi:carbohydrate porin [Sphingomonas sp. XXL09]|uniref:carbohydrate porin n=1 Tax=Sphingomonas sp. XXL09 TaxID=3457787 RepID=UPI00406BABF0
MTNSIYRWPMLASGLLVACPCLAQSTPSDSDKAGSPASPAAQSDAKPQATSPAIFLNNYPKPQVQSTASVAGPPKGPLVGIGQALADRGIYLRALAVDEFAGNVTGGQGRGTANSYVFPFGFDLDFDRLAGWKGAALHYSMNVSQGSSLAVDHTGNAISFQTRYKAVQNLRLAALALEQNLWGGKVNISGGRVAPLTYFNQSNIYCTFQSNSVCFNPAVVPIQDRALGFFPYNTWGGRIKIAPTKWFYAQAGIFEANTSLISTNGFDWSTKGSTGHQTAVEIGLQSADPRARNLYHLRIGAFGNTSDVTDPYLNTRGRPRLGRGAAGGAALVHDGQAGVYVMGDIAAAHMDGDAKRPITVFGGVISATNDYVPFKGQALAGVIVTGPLPGRTNDTFGIVGSYIRLGDRQRQFLQASRALAGGTDTVFPDEGVFEVNYGIAAHRGVRISPNVQYVVSPDNFAKPRAIKRSGDILAFGLRVSIDGAALLGLPAQR